MIVSRTPYRVSLGGGGTDLPAFYRLEKGAVVTAAIQRFLHVAVAPRMTPGIRLHHESIEEAPDAASLPHRIVGEALAAAGIETGVQLWTSGEVPPGTGLGSSSTLAVGLAAAFAAWNGEAVTPEELARRACEIEMDRLGGSLGKQDQTIAAHGGLQFIEFHPDERVTLEKIRIDAAGLRAFETRVLLFFTGKQRAAGSILGEIARVAPEKLEALRAIRDHAVGIRAALEAHEGPDFGRIGEHLHEAWMEKRSLWPGISTAEVDCWYAGARKAGALGGRLLGAGGGGFLMVLAEPDRHGAIREALGHPLELPFEVASTGSRVHDLREPPR
jgi:D-glycero-alpha-D-manno-heptose-7-phosphate kinase